MKKFACLALGVGLVFGALATSAAADDDTKTNAVLEIKAAAAKDNVGKEASVSGTVAQISKAQGLVRLNLEKPFPNQPFTAVIFARHTNHFGDLESFKGKKIEVTGKITEYRGRPQIILVSTNQLKVVESEADKTEKK
jgi:DNA/RNA endonuclease YhcR with UshA esterase domain